MLLIVLLFFPINLFSMSHQDYLVKYNAKMQIYTKMNHIKKDKTIQNFMLTKKEAIIQTEDDISVHDLERDKNIYTYHDTNIKKLLSVVPERNKILFCRKNNETVSLHWSSGSKKTLTPEPTDYFSCFSNSQPLAFLIFSQSNITMYDTDNLAKIGSIPHLLN